MLNRFSELRYGAYVFLVLIVCGLLYHASFSLAPRTFTTFVTPVWENTGGCRRMVKPAQQFPLVDRVVTWNPRNPIHQASCTSEWFVPQGNYLEIEFAGFVDLTERDMDTVYIAVENESGQELARFIPRYEQVSGTWKQAKTIFRDMPEGKIRLRIHDQAVGNGWIALRRRVNFYSINVTNHDRFQFFRWSWWKIPVRVLFALSVALTVVWITLQRSRWIFVSALVLLCTFIHYRTDVYFSSDDFMFLDKLTRFGLGGVIQRHNEHIIPIFTGFLYGQYLLFGDAYGFYLLVSMVLMGITALLLRDLLVKFSSLLPEEAFSYGSLKYAELGANLVAILFAISGLHTETMQWVTCQCILLMLIAFLTAFNALWNYLQYGERRALMVVSLAVFASPLVFGSGFMVGPYCVMLIVLGVWGAGAIRRRRALWAFGASTLPLLPCLGVYYLYRRIDGIGLKLEDAALPAMNEVGRFVFFGPFFGTILRGVGITPYFGTDEVAPILKAPFPLLNVSLYQRGIILGLLVTAISLVFLFMRPQWRRFIGAWLFGFVLLITPFIFFAVGRARFGVDYSLQLRYHTISLLGVCIMFLPLLSNGVKTVIRTSSFSSIATPVLLSLLLFAHCYSQISLSQKLITYGFRGEQQRSYIEQVIHWNSLLGGADAQKEVLETGAGTPYAGSMPFLFAGNPYSPKAEKSQFSSQTLLRIFD